MQNVPGLGLGRLGEIDHTDVVHSSNERSQRTEQVTVRCHNILLQKSIFAQPNPRKHQSQNSKKSELTSTNKVLDERFSFELLIQRKKSFFFQNFAISI